MEFALYNSRKGVSDENQSSSLLSHPHHHPAYLPNLHYCFFCFVTFLFLVSTDYSPSHVRFPVSWEFTYPTCTLISYLPSEFLLTGIQFPNVAFSLVCILAVCWGKKVWMALDLIMVIGNCQTHQLFRLEEINQMNVYLPFLMNEIYYLGLFFEPFGKKKMSL